MYNLGWEREGNVGMFLGELRVEGHGGRLGSGGLVAGLVDRVYSTGAKL